MAALTEPIQVEGADLPLSMPIGSFDPSEVPQLSAQLLENLSLVGHTAPTALQSYIVPLALAGRDALVVGAGREAQATALLLPVVARLLALDPRAAGPGGLRAVVLAPTRETASQTVREARQLVRRTPLRCTLACGGVALDETLAELGAGVELLVATPGRLVDLLERGRVSLGGVRHLALLGIDALLDGGFEAQLRWLLQQEGLASAQERQMLLSCAQLSPALKRLLPGGGYSSDLAKADLVTVRVADGAGALQAACDNSLVTQQVIFAEEQSKQLELGRLVREAAGLTVVVCSAKRRCEMVGYLLQGEQLAEVVTQPEKLKPKDKEAALHAFASGKSRVLLLSDAGLHELQLPSLGVRISHLIGFDLPSNGMQGYAERMACCGRHGHTSVLSTLIGENESREALQHLMALLRESDSDVPRWLEGQATLSHSAPPAEVTAGGW